MKWPVTALFAVFDLIFASAIAYFVQPQDRLIVFGVALAALWLLPMAIGFWHFIEYWLAYHLFIKRRLVRFYKAQFHQHKFPPSAAFFDHMTYLSSVMDDEEVELSTKLKAAFFVGEMTGFKDTHPATLGYAAPLSFQQAMEEYRP